MAFHFLFPLCAFTKELRTHNGPLMVMVVVIVLEVEEVVTAVVKIEGVEVVAAVSGNITWM